MFLNTSPMEMVAQPCRHANDATLSSANSPLPLTGTASNQSKLKRQEASRGQEGGDAGVFTHGAQGYSPANGFSQRVWGHMSCPGSAVMCPTPPSVSTANLPQAFP